MPLRQWRGARAGRGDRRGRAQSLLELSTLWKTALGEDWHKKRLAAVTSALVREVRQVHIQTCIRECDALPLARFGARGGEEEEEIRF